MSGQLLVQALAFAHTLIDEFDGRVTNASPPALLVSSRPARDAIAPRMSDVCALDPSMLALVMRAPTAWCTAELRIASPHASGLLLVPATFPQLRRVEVSCAVPSADALAAMLCGVCGGGGGGGGGGAGWIREIVLGPGDVRVTNAVLRAIAPVVGRLHTLEVQDCSQVTGDVHSHLRDMWHLRGFHVGFADRLADSDLSEMLAGSPLLQSLTVVSLPLVAGAFLDMLPGSIREIVITSCTAFCDQGAEHLVNFRGLESFNVQACPSLTTLPLARLPPLRTVRECFLGSLTSLGSLDLSSLINVACVPDYFLYCVTSLTALDLSGLRNVVTVGDEFLQGATGLPRLTYLRSATSKQSAADSAHIAQPSRLSTPRVCETWSLSASIFSTPQAGSRRWTCRKCNE